MFYSLQKTLSPPLFPLISSISYPISVRYNAPVFDPQRDISLINGFINGSAFVGIKGVSLVSDGFVYLAVRSGDSEGIVEFESLRNGSLSGFMTFLQVGKVLEYNFTDLSNHTLYNVYYVGSDEDPGQFASFSSVNSLSVNTSSITESSGSGRTRMTIITWIIAFLMILSIQG